MPSNKRSRATHQTAPDETVRIECDSEDATLDLARALGQAIRSPLRLALNGTLGAGKTAFIRGLSEGLDIHSAVNSPTYVLIKTHRGGRLPLHHCDWYRHRTEDDILSSGFEDLELEPGIIAVEWAGRFPAMLEKPYLEIQIEITGEGKRALTFQGQGDDAELRKLIDTLREWHKA